MANFEAAETPTRRKRKEKCLYIVHSVYYEVLKLS